MASKQSRKHHALSVNDGMRSQLLDGIATQNEFDMLSDEDEGQEDLRGPAEATPVTVKKVRCPPIYVKNKSVTDVNNIITSLNINRDDYLLRVSRGTIQVSLKNQDHFSSLFTYLKVNDIAFFTHRAQADIPAKFVLSGLPAFSIEEVSSEMKVNNLLPIDVKMLKATSSGDSALFVVSFKRGTYKLQELKQVRSMFNVIVNWRPFSKKATDIVQCFRCQQFGHGMNHCYLQPKCVKCGELHLTNECKIPKKSAEQNGNDNNRKLIKCANCSRNHTASFRGCPTRLAYLKQLEDRKNLARSRQSKQFRPQSVPVQSGVLFSDTVKGTNEEHSSNLFTLSEFLSLARELYTRLTACTSKGMQFLALSELMAKYVCDG